MKTTLKKRITAILLAGMLALTSFVGCNKQGYEDLKDANQGVQAENTGGENNQNNDKDYSEELAAIQAQINNLTTEVNLVKAENEELRNENATLKAEAEENKKALEEANEKATSAETAKEEAEAKLTELETEVVELEALVETLKAQTTHKIHVIDNIVWVHIDDFLYAANGVGAIVNAEDGSGYAIRTLKGVHVKVYDDECGDEHLVPNFDLPMYDYYTIVLTADEGKTAFTANFGNYNWANRGLVTNFQNCSFVKELRSMPKNGGSGHRFYNLIKNTAVVVEENGTYRFALDAGEYGSNPVITPTCQHGKGCHCGDCDKCPALEVETIVKTETIEKIVEVEKVIEVPGETVYVPGETVYVPGETVYVPGETIYVDREVEVEVEVKYCGRCDNLLEECTCSNPEHNERPSDEDDGPAHNDRPTNNTETPEHNDKTETEDDTPEHNDRPGSTTSNSGHSERPNASDNNNEGGAGTTTDAPAHSPRP